jgi:hypothetical protein
MDMIAEELEVFSRISPRCLRRIIAQAPIGIAILGGPALVYEYVNPYFQAFAPRHELIGRAFAEASWELSQAASTARAASRPEARRPPGL